MLKPVALHLVLAFVVMQFFRPVPNVSANPPGQEDFLVRNEAPAEVRQIFAVACYDCHSNNTRYPWYSQVQPLAWWLDSHVRDGLNELNLSELGGSSPGRQASKAGAMLDTITDRSMPLPSYTIAHRDAKLTDAQIDTVTEWLEAVIEKLEEEDEDA